MAQEEDNSKELPITFEPPFLEILCKSSSKVRRFASGTDAGFALHLINSKLGFGVPPALYIEAVKEGEEPISFGPKAALVNYGEGWKLQTAIEEKMKEGYEAASQKHQMPKQIEGLMKSPGSGSNGKSKIRLQYYAKVLFAMASMFLLGGVLVFFLESLPWLIQLITSA